MRHRSPTVHRTLQLRIRATVANLDHFTLTFQCADVPSSRDLHGATNSSNNSLVVFILIVQSNLLSICAETGISSLLSYLPGIDHESHDGKILRVNIMLIPGPRFEIRYRCFTV